jgi:exodeoxyribonuclease-3
VRVASWNVNSVKSRLPRLLPWLADRAPDVLLMQETKSTDEAWPAETFTDLGYDSEHLGTGRWNGVAVLSRVGLEHLTLGLPGQPPFEGVIEPRAIGVSCAGVRLWSLYVPNGRRAGSPHYAYKLAFLDAIRAHATQEAEALSDAPLGLLGDFNVAPTDADVWDPAVFDGGTHVSVAERAALEALRTGVGRDGLTDLLPRASADPTTRGTRGRSGRCACSASRSAAACASTWRWSTRRSRRGSPTPGSTAMRGGARRRPTTRRSCSTSTDPALLSAPRPLCWVHGRSSSRGSALRSGPIAVGRPVRTHRDLTVSVSTAEIPDGAVTGFADIAGNTLYVVDQPHVGRREALAGRR